VAAPGVVVANDSGLLPRFFDESHAAWVAAPILHFFSGVWIVQI